MSGELYLPYQKWEATGNDFVVVDLADCPLEEGELTPEMVRRICHRRDGVGADGVVLLGRAEGPQPARMVIWNSDGSRGDMCGNALRCVALILAESRDEVHPVAVGERLVRARAGGPDYSRVEMGPASSQGAYPIFSSLPELDRVLGGRGYLLSFGNPHYVVPLAEIPEDWAARGAAAQALADAALGTGGINCGFLQTRPELAGHFPLRVFERGVGVTRSCGSGACAASAVLEGPLGVQPPHRLELLGGILEIGRTEGAGFELGGPARREFVGRWRL